MPGKAFPDVVTRWLQGVDFDAISRELATPIITDEELSILGPYAGFQLVKTSIDGSARVRPPPPNENAVRTGLNLKLPALPEAGYAGTCLFELKLDGGWVTHPDRVGQKTQLPYL